MLSRRMTRSLPGCFGIGRLLSSAASPVRAACLESRSAIRISGQDAGKFLQGLVTQDVLGLLHPVAPVQYAHILNAKGRTKYDIMIYPKQPGDTTEYLLETDKVVLQPLHAMLKMYRMRAKVEFSEWNGEWKIWALRSGDNDAASAASVSVPPGGRSGPDPRMPGFHRLALPASSDAPPTDCDLVAEYTRARFRHGICEGVEELSPDDALPLEHNLDLYAGVCFKKGCYVGQELTARTHFTGVVRKRALPVRLLAGSGADLAVGHALASRGADGQLKRAGKLRAWFGDCGVAVVPVDLARSSPTTVLCLKTGSEDSSTLAIGDMSPELEKAVAGG